jgi:uncharacterized membrane protein (UPF0182 family)
MRVPTDDRPRRRLGMRAWIIGAVVVLLILLMSLRGLAHFYTDYLWFDEVGFGDTWRGLLGARLVPALVFTVIFFVAMLLNLTIADRLAPRNLTMGPEDEMIERYRTTVAPYSGRIRLGISLFFALIAGAGVSAQWREWLLFRNRVDFGITDPQFNRDVGFYVFELPFIRFAIEWAFLSLVIILLVTAVFHYVNGGIRLQSPFQRVTPQVKAHLSVLLAAMALVKTAQYYFDRFELNFSSRGATDGASYTDVNAQLPALNLLMWISVAAAVLFIANIWRRGWVLPIIAVGLWGFISLVVGTIYPEVIQRIQVRPNEFAREEPYIERNIESTLAAFDLTDVDVRDFEYGEDLTPTDIDANRETLENARLWDPGQIDKSFQELQEFRSFYEFSDVDVDRYPIGSEEREPVMISTRELDEGGLPSSTWTNRHLTYTHGYGAVAATANQVDRENAPSFVLSGLENDGELEVDRPGIYFGENLGGYVVVNTAEGEVEPAAGGEERVNYEGSGGVQVSSLLKKAALAARFGDWNLFVSGQVESNSRAIFLRDVRERVEKAAPFLAFDADPYPVIVDGRVLWIVDGYTTSTKYPYSQSIRPQALDGNSGLATEFNYVRNSVKAVVDAYDGEISFYVVDEQDPIIEAWSRAFPELFAPMSDMPAGLESHFRYPEDLFKAQTEQFAIYHIQDPRQFYNKEDIWDVAPQPISGATVTDATVPSGPTSSVAGNNGGRNDTLAGTGDPINPLYQTMQLPEESNGQEFMLVRSYVPIQTNNQLSAFMVAKSDPGAYGQLIVYRTRANQEAPSPTQIATQIDSDPDISEQFTLLDARGSRVIRGDIQLIPVENSIIWARPIYVQGQGASSFPRFRFLVVSYGRTSVLAADIDDGLAQIFEGAPPRVDLEDSGTDPPDGSGDDNGTTTTTTSPPTTPTTQPELPDDVEELLEIADEAFADAEAALQDGDLVTWAQRLEEAQEAVAEARRLSSESASTTTAPEA